MSYKDALIKNLNVETSSVKTYVTSDSDDELNLSKLNNYKKKKVNKDKNEALLKAQDILIQSCIPNKKISEKIFKNINNQK